MNEAVDYYNSQRPGLGRAFLDAVSHAERRIQEHPAPWAFRKKPVRRSPLDRFPYQLLFVDEPGEIVLIAVMHVKRDPEYRPDRLGKY